MSTSDLGSIFELTSDGGLDPRLQWTPRALPQTRNTDGRPVWEPPVLDYSDLIDKEYEKKREAVLTCFHNDVSTATSYMDADTELELIEKFQNWVGNNCKMAAETGVIEGAAFYAGLLQELSIDHDEVYPEHSVFGRRLDKRGDGTYTLHLLGGELWTQSNTSDEDHREEESTYDDASEAGFYVNLYGPSHEEESQGSDPASQQDFLRAPVSQDLLPHEDRTREVVRPGPFDWAPMSFYPPPPQPLAYSTAWQETSDSINEVKRGAQPAPQANKGIWMVAFARVGRLLKCGSDAGDGD